MSDYEGQEIKKGEIALEKGTERNPGSSGFIWGLGIRKIRVYRKPRVAFLVTGEELVGIDQELKPGKIRDTNSITLSTALSQENVEFLFLGRARDELSDIEEKLKKGLEWGDVLIVTGGVSVGEYDYVKRALGDLGVEGIFWRVAQRPGGPMFFGKKGEILIFGLPGNPTSSLVCFYEYVRPALLRMLAKEKVFLLEMEAALLEDITKKPDGNSLFKRLFRKSRKCLLCKICRFPRPSYFEIICPVKL